MRVRLGAAVLLALSLATCGSTPPSVLRPTAAATPAPATPAPASPTPAASGSVVVDRSLLGVLPPDVSGFAVTESSEAEASVSQSSDLAPVATAFAAGLTADPAGGNWAFGVVVALRPGVMSDATFRAWRDSYDVGACSQAGGVVGHAETQLGGRIVYITACGGGVHTYHVWLPARQRLVSISAVGERRFGELLVKGIRD